MLNVKLSRDVCPVYDPVNRMQLVSPVIILTSYGTYHQLIGCTSACIQP